jgi:glucose-1-phosphatase
MIDNIIFDLGDVFINLNHEKVEENFRNLGLKTWSEDLKILNSQYEIGKITELQFLEGFQKHLPNADLLQIRAAWNGIIGEFPLYRLEFLQKLKRSHKLYLLSNTDETHINKFEHQSGLTFARDFYSCFEKIYFSFEIGMKKPDETTFKHILNKHNLIPKNTLFVDDKKENTDAAQKLGIKIWNLQVGKEDVVDLFDKKIL